jgi:HicA toxin of bacterial toxin-antitoxin,
MIKTRDLRRHLRTHGCEQLREGAKHSVWQGPGGRSTVPRHREIPRTTARAICDQLGVPRFA